MILKFDISISNIRELIVKLLSSNPLERPDFQECYDTLCFEFRLQHLEQFEYLEYTVKYFDSEYSSYPLKKINPIKITGFKENNKTFGGAICYKAKIDHIDGAIIIPDINKHKEDIIEFIAPVNVKSELNVKNGDKIKIQITNFQ